jgi:hypothetical protein
MTQWLATVIQSPFEAGRWLCCRKNRWTMTTVVSDHLTEASAEAARRELQACFDREAVRAPVDPNEPRQLVLGFYTDEDAR